MSFEFRPGNIPLLISIPHNGADIPDEAKQDMTDAGRSSRDTDWFVDRLYDLPEASGCSWLIAKTSRFVIDLNRPASGESLYPGQTTTSLVPTECFDGTPIHAGPGPDAIEIARRIKEHWQPYHDQLASELGRLTATHGRGVLIDAHSIQPVLPRLFPGRLPDFNLGTNRGAACDQSLAEMVLEPLRQQRSYSWVRDGRFVGGYITRHYGQPDRNVHAFQIELAQSTYLQDDGPEWHADRAAAVSAAARPDSCRRTELAELQLNLASIDKLLVGCRILTMCRPGTVLARDESGEPVFRQPDNDWMSEPLEKMAVGIRAGKIAWIVPEAWVPQGIGHSSRQVGNGLLLTPALIDCHTHLVHAGNRADEWAARLGGKTYAEIARAGGGILSTVRKTRAASEDELVELAASRLVHLLREGVMTVEIKSGYGLDLETELRMLRAARRLEDLFPVRIVTTLLAAHAVPPEFVGRSDDYVAWVCSEMIPAVVGLCSAVDVFCESIAFSLDQTARIFDAAQAAGLAVKVHAEQLTRTGAAVMAAQRGALSVDHLEYLSDADCDDLARTSTVATLLPGAFYCLRERQLPPVAALIRAGVPIAVATDSNPGSSPLLSLLLVANMACNLFGLTPGQALAGVTCHAAQALGLASECGSLTPGARADCCLWRVDSVAELLFSPGHVPPGQFLVGGQPRLCLATGIVGGSPRA